MEQGEAQERHIYVDKEDESYEVLFRILIKGVGFFVSEHHIDVSLD